MRLLSRLIDRRIAQYQDGLIRVHYAEVDNMYRQMRAWRHDFRNHIQAMKSYAAAGDLAAIDRYLDELDADLTQVDVHVKTGNRMADAILSSKIALARARNIPVRADAHIPVTLSTPELSLCVVIGNLFDNAIEASLALPEEKRLIRVYMDMKGEQLYMSFTNFTAEGKLAPEGGRFRSRKGPGHGFGLASIDRVVESAGGYIRRASEEGAFTTEILLPQSPRDAGQT